MVYVQGVVLEDSVCVVWGLVCLVLWWEIGCVVSCIRRSIGVLWWFRFGWG